MKWSWLGRKSSLEQQWSFEAAGNIWRIIPLEGDQIFGEVRQQEQKQATFFCLDEKSGGIRWADRKFEEPWWIGIEAAAHGVAILHTYEKPDLPRHGDLIAVDLKTGRELWRESGAAFWFLNGGRLYAYRQGMESRSIEERALSSGELLRTFDDSHPDVVELRRSAEQNIQTGNIDLPTPFDADADPSLIEGAARWLPEKDRSSGVESLRLDDYLLVSYYVPARRSEGKALEFDNHFRVIDLRRRELLHSELLARSVPSTVPDTFYVRGRRVISVKDLRYLRAQGLPLSRPDPVGGSKHRSAQ